MSIRPCHPVQRGITLVEQIVFIVIVSVGVIGVLSTLGPTLRHSAEPQIRKQQLAIAESLLSEILHQPFTYCDPDDDNAGTAALSGTKPTCAVPGNDQDSDGGTLGKVPATESRSGTAVGGVFDNVADYAGFSEANIADIGGNYAMNGYTASVAISRIGGNYTYAGNTLPAGAALQIAVTVTSPGGEALTLTGYRFRYAPRY